MRLVACVLMSMGWLGCAGPHPTVPRKPAPFVEVAADSGLDFRHSTGAAGSFYLPEIMGSGVALLDFDGDGDLDVYLLQAAATATTRPGSRLYRNELEPGGRLHFADVTAEAGVGFTGFGIGAAVGDVDADGDADLYVTAYGANALYRNDGDGTFTDVTATAGVGDERWSASASFLDYDRDGDLDLYVVNYVRFTPAIHQQCFSPTGAPDYCAPAAYDAQPDALYRNDGDGRFTDVSAAAGLHAAFGRGLGVVATDFDDDGWPDLAVANDGDPNQLWHNVKDGTFTDIAPLAGAAYSETGKAEAGMGIVAEDLDGDGDEDLFLSHLAQETNTLYLNRTGRVFEDSTDAAGLGLASHALTGFGVGALDYDHDGWLDLLVANGAVTVLETQRGQPYPFVEPTLLFRGLGGARFADVSRESGAAFALRESSRGAAFGDLDNDGDVDAVIANGNGPVHLFRNEIGQDRPWVLFDVRAGGSTALGARVGLRRGDGTTLWRRVRSDGSYASASDTRVHFGLGATAGGETVEVRWPDGSRERWRDFPVRRLVRLDRGAGEPL